MIKNQRFTKEKRLFQRNRTFTLHDFLTFSIISYFKFLNTKSEKRQTLFRFCIPQIFSSINVLPSYIPFQYFRLYCFIPLFRRYIIPSTQNSTIHSINQTCISITAISITKTYIIRHISFMLIICFIRYIL